MNFEPAEEVKGGKRELHVYKYTLTAGSSAITWHDFLHDLAVRLKAIYDTVPSNVWFHIIAVPPNNIYPLIQPFYYRGGNPNTYPYIYQMWADTNISGNGFYTYFTKANYDRSKCDFVVTGAPRSGSGQIQGGVHLNDTQVPAGSSITYIIVYELIDALED